MNVATAVQECAQRPGVPIYIENVPRTGLAEIMLEIMRKSASVKMRPHYAYTKGCVKLVLSNHTRG